MKLKPKDLRKKLVKKLLKDGFIQSKKTKKAFLEVPRHFFLPNTNLKEAYSDFSIITKKIGINPISSSTQPSLMASMLENLKLKKGIRVLEIGAGTGYNAAIISEIIQNQKEIFTIDIDFDTVKEAHLNLAKAGYGNITVKCLDGVKGLPEHSPYDRIIITCSVKDFPKSWIKQLKEKGIIVAPIWINGAQITPAFRKQKGILNSFSISSGGFMNLRLKTYQKMLEKKSKLLKQILICSEHPKFFNENKIISLLQKGHEEKPLPLKDAISSRRYDFFVFLSLYEKRSVELFIEKNIKKIGFKNNAVGIIDLQKKSACLISKNHKLLTYGNPHTYKKILSIIKKWDHLKRPGINQLKILISPNNIKLFSKENDIIFKKKSTQYIIRISIS